MADDRPGPLQLAVLAAVLCGVMLAGASPARADVLTGHARSSFRSGSPSSPTHPVLRDASIRYDADQGSMLVVVRLHGALAPSSTRALRAWSIEVELGEFKDSLSCLGRGSTRPAPLRSVSDVMRASVGGAGAGTIEIDGQVVSSAPVIEAVNADRTQIVLGAQSSTLAHRHWICWDASLYRRDATAQLSNTDPAFFDGRDNADSPFGPYATAKLSEQVRDLNRLLSGKSRLLTFPGRTRCTQLHGALAACRVRVRMNDVAGRPTLAIRGRVRYDDELSTWVWSARARLAWQRRCPRRVDAAREDRSCALKLRWRGDTSLDDLFRRALRLRRTRTSTRS
jgi:hypothetical protein